MLTLNVLFLPVVVLATCLVFVAMFLDVAFFRPAPQPVQAPLKRRLPLPEVRSLPHWPMGMPRSRYNRLLRQPLSKPIAERRIHRPRNTLTALHRVRAGSK
jgi:hypothetical protein